MKFSIEKAVLNKAVSQAQSVVERRNTIPILANVLIEATAEGVSFRATDLDTEVVDRTAAHVERPGATTVSAQMLNEIARKLPDGALVNIAFDAASGRVSVQAGRANFNLATLDGTNGFRIAGAAGETAGNAGNVDKQQLENMQRVGAGTIDSSR